MPATDIVLPFADGKYRFALFIPQIHELQEKCGAGIGAIYARVLQGRMAGDIGTAHPGYAAYHIDDIVETVRQGLIGGAEGLVSGETVKVTSLRADDLVERYLHPMPLKEQWDLAASILFAKIEGYDDGTEPSDEDKKKAETVDSTMPQP